jgi:hypothetical protein
LTTAKPEQQEFQFSFPEKKTPTALRVEANVQETSVNETVDSDMTQSATSVEPPETEEIGSVDPELEYHQVTM